MNKCIQIILLLFVCCTHTVVAQNINVSSFKLLENDLTANVVGTMERDQNGEVAALIKVVTTEQGFIFDGGMTGIVKTKQGVGELWVYVSHGIKRITVQHSQLGVLRDYYFPITIEKGKTYEMVLTIGKVETIVTRTAGKQYVMFTVSPTYAVVELDGMPLELVDGYAEKSMAYGTYDYRVLCANYHSEVGKLTVSSEGKVEKNISLRPNFGWIKFDGDTGSLGADVYINGERVGQLPFTTEKLKSGTYSVKVAKNMYKNYETQVMISDNETVNLSVQLQPIFGWIELEGAKEFHGAHVYINDERVGQLPLTTNKLLSGTYRVKVVKSLYKLYEQQVKVTDNSTTKLNVNLIPNFANITLVTDAESEIWIDNRLSGKGKCIIDLEPGEYTVEVKRPSHHTISDVITISELTARTIQLPFPTPIYGVLDIISSPSRAIVYIDGVEVGQTPLILDNVLVGSRKVTFKKEGYKITDQIVNINDNIENEVSVVLKELISCEPIDLGLSVKWASCNVGATLPEEYGGYFAWGETKEKSSYTQEKSVTYGRSTSKLKSRGIIDSDGNLTASYDVATVNWGCDWRMPTLDEIKELRNKCSWSMTTMNGVKGYKITGTNGNSIFLPAAGYRDNMSVGYVGSDGLYWSATSDGYSCGACSLYFETFDSDNYDINNNGRYFGFTVRPVSEQ